MRILMKYVVQDGYVELVPPNTALLSVLPGNGFAWVETAGPPPAGRIPDVDHYRLTSRGLQFLDAWLGAQPIEDVKEA
jgi:hypothetical protein